MSTTETKMLRQALFVEVEKLPEDGLREALDFVRYLIFKSTYQPLEEVEDSPDSPQETTLDADQNPLLEFIGGVSHGTLAHDIDEELLSS